MITRNEKFNLDDCGVQVVGNVVREDDNVYYMWSATWHGTRIACPDFGARSVPLDTIFAWMRQRDCELYTAALADENNFERLESCNEWEARYGSRHDV